MTYYVQIAQRVRDYVAAVEGLSTAGQTAVYDGVEDELGRDAEKYLSRYPLGPESLHFRYDYVQPDDRTLFVFDFIVDGTAMAVGVVTVVHAECEAHPAP